jgi:hypothetical protein
VLSSRGARAGGETNIGFSHILIHLEKGMEKDFDEQWHKVRGSKATECPSKQDLIVTSL